MFPATRSIAVLPFQNLNESDQEYFSDGVTEEIINALARTPNLNVAGRTSSFAFRGENPDLQRVSEELHADYVLKGTVQRSGSRVQVAVQLVNAGNAGELWQEKYDREIEDIFDVQDEIAAAILQEVNAQLSAETQAPVFKRYTNNTEAYQLYLHGRFYHNKFGGTEEFNKAIVYFQSAIALDPAYAVAHAGIASCYLNMWFYRLMPAAKAIGLMKEATGQALRLDDSIDESYLALARMHMLYEWDFSSAAAAFQKALAISPNAPELLGQYGLYLALTGAVTEAQEHIRQALNLEPFSLINNFYGGYVYWIAEDFELAVAQGRKLVAMDPEFWGGHIITGLNLITLRAYAEAQEALEMAMEINYNGITLSACGVLFGLSGELESARDILTQMNALAKTQVVSNYDMGIVNAAIGETDTAVRYFEAAIEKHEPPMLFFRYIVRDWLTGTLADARYCALIAKIVRK